MLSGVGVAAVVKLYYYLKWDQPQKLRGKNIAGTPIMFFTNLPSCLVIDIEFFINAHFNSSVARELFLL